MVMNVQDLLDFAQIKVGKFKKQITKFSVSELVKSVIRMQKDKAEQ